MRERERERAVGYSSKNLSKYKSGETCVPERELRDIAAGSYRSTMLEKLELEKERRDIAAGSYTSRSLEKLVLEKERERETEREREREKEREGERERQRKL